MLTIITENKLDEWVSRNQEAAKGTVVELVYRLVAASFPNPIDRRFPLGDSLNQRGADGILNVGEGLPPFVPGGHSFWQIGTGTRPQSKISDDYAALNMHVSKKTRQKATFVFVTPRSDKSVRKYGWKKVNQDKWIEKHRDDGEWKDRRIIDGTRLIDWVHQFPAVELWLAEQISASGLKHTRTLESHWEATRTAGTSLLSPSLFLNNRDDACQNLQDAVCGNNQQVRLITRFPSQSVDFASAYVASLEEQRRVEAFGRCLVISDLEDWNTFCNQFWGSDLVLVADVTLDMESETGRIALQRAREAGHTIIYHALPGGLPDELSVSLKSPKGDQTKEALMESGYTEPRADQLSRLCQRNLSQLLHIIQGHTSRIEASTPSESALVRTALLIGSWNSASVADHDAIGELAGIDYEKCVELASRISSRSNPAIIDQGGDWKFVSRFEGWYDIGTTLRDEHLGKFIQIAESVFNEEDPYHGLSFEERLKLSMEGKALHYSPQLRKGIAETLALLGSHPDALQSCTPGVAKHLADRAVQNALMNADWTVWVNLSRQLPLLAEASPDCFLDAIEEAINQTSCLFDNLFEQESNTLLGNNNHYWILWALETLAWDEKFMARSCELLGYFSHRYPAEKYHNKSLDSLARILLPWHPQTTASVDHRLDFVRALRIDFPSVAWQLLLALTPSGRSFTHSTHRPTWRDSIDEDWEESIRQNAYLPKFQEQLIAYLEMLIEMAITDVDRLGSDAFFHRLDFLPQHLFDQVMGVFSPESISELTKENCVQIWIAFSRYMRHYEEYLETKSDRSQQDIARMRSIVQMLAPTDQDIINGLLFSPNASHLFEEQEDWKETERIEIEMRKKAIEDLLASEGLEKILGLAKTAELPREVGSALATLSGHSEDERILPSLIESENEKLQRFARSYVWGRHYRKGWQWIDDLDMSGWSVTEKAHLLSCLPFNEETWQRAETILNEKEGEYWIRSVPNPYGSLGNIQVAIDKLIEYGRPKSALWCIEVLMKDMEFDQQQAIRALTAAVSSDEPTPEHFQYTIIHVIKELQKKPEDINDNLWMIEWMYLDFLDHHLGASPVSLENRLASDPEFFCQVIQTVFFAENETRPSEPTDEKVKAFKQNAYSLLFGWKTPPGMRPDKTFSPDAFTKWLDHVKNACRKSGHLIIALEQIGQVLIHCQNIDDNLWLPHVVAKALNERDASDLRRGFRLGISNSRGVFIVDPTGKPESDLAAKYEQKADEMERLQFSRLARTLRDLADSYHFEAQQRIIEAEKED